MTSQSLEARETAYARLQKALIRMQRQAKDAIDPPEGESLDYLITQVMDSAHELLDLAHEFRAALRANPPPKNPVENDEGDLQSTR